MSGSYKDARGKRDKREGVKTRSKEGKKWRKEEKEGRKKSGEKLGKDRPQWG